MQKKMTENEPTLCAWCGKELSMGFHAHYFGEYICKKCYMFSYRTKRKDLNFWREIKRGQT